MKRSPLRTVCFLLGASLLFLSATATAKKKRNETCAWKNASITKKSQKIRDFKGWDVYTPALACNHTQLKVSPANQKTIEGLLVTFFGDLLHQRASYTSLLAPKTPPAFRAGIKSCLLQQVKGFKRFIVHARIDSKTGSVRGNRHARKYLQVGKMMFGSFDHLVFMEGNDSRNDIIVYVKKHDGKWYVKGFWSVWLRKCFAKKKPWWSKKKK